MKDAIVTVVVAILLAILFLYLVFSLAFSGWGDRDQKSASPPGRASVQAFRTVAGHLVA
jgi:hypothetical protein